MNARLVKAVSATGGGVLVGAAAFVLCGMAGLSGEALACGCLAGAGGGIALGAWLGPAVFGLAAGL